MKAEILTLLRQRQDYISGQELCEKFGVSRTAVWKAVNQLKKEGYVIEAVQNKGYRLADVPEILSKDELESRIRTAWAGSPVYFYDEVDSTNIQAKRLAEEQAPHGSLVVADKQTAGRGRRGREWESPAGSNVYFTILLRPQFHPGQASMLTLVMALSVAKGIKSLTGAEAGIKWPNDIVLNGRKIVGILTEMSAEPDFIHHVVIGVGINVAKQGFPEELEQKAAALETELGRKVSRAALIQKIMEYFEEDYTVFVKAGDMSLLIGEYNCRLVNLDREVCVLDPAGEFNGIARGIDKNGELLVEVLDGSIRQVYAGEVSVRGIYGYV